MNQKGLQYVQQGTDIQEYDKAPNFTSFAIYFKHITIQNKNSNSTCHKKKILPQNYMFYNFANFKNFPTMQKFQVYSTNFQTFPNLSQI